MKKLIPLIFILFFFGGFDVPTMSSLRVLEGSSVLGTVPQKVGVVGGGFTIPAMKNMLVPALGILRTSPFNEQAFEENISDIRIVSPRVVNVSLLPLRYQSFSLGGGIAQAVSSFGHKNRSLPLFDQLSLSVFCSLASLSTSVDTSRCNYETLVNSEQLAVETEKVTTTNTSTTTSSSLSSTTPSPRTPSFATVSSSPVYINNYITKYIEGTPGRDGTNGRDGKDGISPSPLSVQGSFGGFVSPSISSPTPQSLIGVSTIGYLKGTLIDYATFSYGTSTNMYLANANVNSSIFNGYNTFNDTAVFTGTTIVNSLTATTSTLVNTTLTNSTTTTAYVDSLTVATSTISSLTVTNASTTNATTTNLSVTNLETLNASTTNSTTTNAFITNLTTALSNFINLFATNATTTNFFATSSRLVNATSTTFYTDTLSVGDGTVQGNQTVNGILTVNGSTTLASNTLIAGSVTLGTSTSNNITVNGLFNSSLIPNANNTYDLGSPSFYWRNGYLNTLNVNTLSAGSTTISGTQSNNFTINTDNVTTDGEDSTLVFYRGTVPPNAVIKWNATTKRFEFNQSTNFQDETPSTGSTTLSVQAGQGQSTRDLFKLLTNGGATLSVFTSSGYLGIGSSTPNYPLTVTGNTYLGGNLTATGTLDVTGKTTLTNASTSNITISGVLYVPSISGLTSLSLTDLTATNATTTLAAFSRSSTTNAFISNASTTNLSASGAFFTSFFATNASTSNASSSNLSAGGASITNFFSSNASTTNFSAGGLFATNAFLNGLTTTNETITNSTTTLAAFSRSSTTNAFITNASTTNLSASGFFSTSGYIGQASSTALTVSGQTILAGSGGNVGVGTANPQGKLDVTKSGKGTIVGLDSTAQASGVGGTLDLGGNYRASGDYQPFVRIAAEKANATDNNYAYNMAFYTTPNNGATYATKVMTLDSIGNVGIGTVSPGTARVLINGPASGGASATEVLALSNYEYKTSFPAYGSNETAYINTYFGNGISGENVYDRYLDIGIRGAGDGTYGASVIRFLANGISSGATPGEVMRINGRNGNVGIGTVNPTSKLYISGTTTGSTPYITFNSSYATPSYIGVSTQNNDIVTGDVLGDTVIDSGNNLLITTGGNNLRMKITSTGNVGIGTVSPAATLHVVSATNPSRFSYGAESGSALDIVPSLASGTKIRGNYYSGVGDINLVNSGDGTIMYLKESNGNIGIGTTTPLAKLTVVAASAGDGVRVNTNGLSSGYSIFDGSTERAGLCFAKASNQCSSGAVSGDITLYNVDSGATGKLILATGASPTHRMTIDGSGNVGIGTTTPLAKLDITGDTTTYAGMAKIYLTDMSSNSGSRNWSIGNGGSAYGNLTFAVSPSKGANAGDASSVNAMVISSAGKVGIGETGPAYKLAVNGASETTFTNNPAMLKLYSTDAFATNMGGGINFGGVYTGSTQTTFGYIGGVKENATDGNYAGKLIFGTRTNGSGGTDMTRMTIDSTGYVGIGTSGPSELLHLDTGANTRGLLIADSGDQNLGIRITGTQFNGGNDFGGRITAQGYASVYGTLQFSQTIGNAGSIRDVMTIDRSGNLGVGTTSPFIRTSTAGINVAAASDVGVRIDSTIAGGNALFIARPGSSADAYFTANPDGGTRSMYVSNQVAGNLYFGTGGIAATDMVIDGSHNVGIGVAPSTKLDILAASNKKIQVYTPSAASGITDFSTGGVGWLFSEPGAGTMNSGIFTYNTAGGAKDNMAISSRSETIFLNGSDAPSGNGESMRINTSGNLGIGTTTPLSKLTIVSGSPGNPYSGVGLYSGSASAYTSYTIGRTGVDGYFGVSGGTNDYLTGSTAGDTVVLASTGKLLLGTGAILGTVGLAVSSGNVGIGTTTPLTSLVVAGTGLTIYASATTTSNVGMNITSGCYAVNNACINDTVVRLSGISVATTSTNWSKPSNLSYIVVELWGGGGGGGGVNAGGAGPTGGTGGSTSFYGSATSTGGVGGTGGSDDGVTAAGTGGTGGVGSGSNIVIMGNKGLAGSLTAGGIGGNAPRGGIGGSSSGVVGQPFGGGGAGGYLSYSGGGGGGGGGYTQKTFTAADLAGTSTIRVLVGAAGTASGANDVNGGAGGAGGYVIYEYTTVATGADVAENYPVEDPSIAPGEIVSFDKSNPLSVKRAVEGDTSPLAGIISTNPGVTLDDTKDGIGKRPVALSGRVPTKVTTEGGAIKVGDRITLSSVPGVGKKATQFDDSVGIAITPYDGEGVGTVTVFMNLQKGLSIREIGKALLVPQYSASSSLPTFDFVGDLISTISLRVFASSTQATSTSSTTSTTSTTSSSTIIDYGTVQNALTLTLNSVQGITNRIDFSQAPSDVASLRLDSTGALHAIGFFTPTTSSVAELYTPEEAVDQGMLVTFSTTTYDMTEGTSTYQMAGIKKAISSSHIVGVVTTSSGLTTGTAVNGIPVVFSGRVRVQVTDEYGLIQQGDYITVSTSTPGKGTKATTQSHIGIALSSDNGSHSILMYLISTYQTLDTTQATTTNMLTTGNIDLNANAVAITNIKSLASANGSWSIDENGRITGKVLCIEDVCIDKTTLTNILNSTGQTSIGLPGTHAFADESGSATSSTTTATTTETITIPSEDTSLVSTSTDTDAIDTNETSTTTPEETPITEGGVSSSSSDPVVDTSTLFSSPNP